MCKFILWVIGITLILMYCPWVIAVGGLLWFGWIIGRGHEKGKKETIESMSKNSQKRRDAEKKKGGINDFTDDDGVVDWEGHAMAEVKSKMKEGFEDDPEWREDADRIRKYMAAKRKESEREEQEDINKELNKKEQEFWTKQR